MSSQTYCQEYPICRIQLEVDQDFFNFTYRTYFLIYSTIVTASIFHYCNLPATKVNFQVAIYFKEDPLYPHANPTYQSDQVKYVRRRQHHLSTS